MPKLIKDGKLSKNLWHLVPKEADLAEAVAISSDHLLVHISLWREHKSELFAFNKNIGVWMDSDDDAYELANDVNDLSLIAVNFPVFKDGRSFSNAAILRLRLSFNRELRAIGDVLRDQMFYMKKCGIKSFELSDTVDAEEALAAFTDFADNYQSTVEDPAPLFRRR
ncbi:MAG: DUF934 domain-containing protein [Pseudomonadales bacterium]